MDYKIKLNKTFVICFFQFGLINFLYDFIYIVHYSSRRQDLTFVTYNAMFLLPNCG